MNYVRQDFSWASLMAMPANLTSFCLPSTYDTLPSPANLERWRTTTEIMCTLRSKDICTTDTEPISPKSSIKFVRKGTKVPPKRTPPVGILHHASDSILLGDLNKTYFSQATLSLLS